MFAVPVMPVSTSMVYYLIFRVKLYLMWHILQIMFDVEWIVH